MKSVSMTVTKYSKIKYITSIIQRWYFQEPNIFNGNY